MQKVHGLHEANPHKRYLPTPYSNFKLHSASCSWWKAQTSAFEEPRVQASHCVWVVSALLRGARDPDGRLISVADASLADRFEAEKLTSGITPFSKGPCGGLQAPQPLARVLCATPICTERQCRHVETAVTSLSGSAPKADVDKRVTQRAILAKHCLKCEERLKNRDGVGGQDDKLNVEHVQDVTAAYIRRPQVDQVELRSGTVIKAPQSKEEWEGWEVCRHATGMVPFWLKSNATCIFVGERSGRGSDGVGRGSPA